MKAKIITHESGREMLLCFWCFGWFGRCKLPIEGLDGVWGWTPVRPRWFWRIKMLGFFWRLWRSSLWDWTCGKRNEYVNPAPGVWWMIATSLYQGEVSYEDT